jgi:Arc/MetJ-type ribon-helix-helix transcriptional regulator
MKEQKFVNVRLPRNVYDRVREHIDEHDGLFEDESDFVSHCVIHYTRNCR